MNTKFHKWYDKIREPYRLLMLMGFVLVCSLIINEYIPLHPSTAFLLMCLAGISRSYYLLQMTKDKLS